ncbi:MAG: tryptophan synthase subunit alpha [Candidatus Pelagadaptatus aseana]|uniref:tryptophan synthase subunit alpha n=1 Tax=Candidatus Pelagadaptatus aseana TaxID=3120508 RepID=UPI0039B14893
MTRIASCLDSARKEGRKALVAYIVNGDPYPQATLPTMHAMVAAGVDIIELGVPFSDPMAEGPTIQLGHERSLEHGTSLHSSFELVKRFRETNTDTPVVLMGYANPIERMGYANAAKAAAESGVDGYLTVDLPPEEAANFDKELKAVDLNNIFLVAPTTTEARSREILELASGFVYYVSLKGVTGAGHLDTQEVNAKVAGLRAMADTPICVGFGIKDAESAKAVTAQADGAVVGSLLVNRMGELADAEPDEVASAVAELLKPIRTGLDEL